MFIYERFPFVFNSQNCNDVQYFTVLSFLHFGLRTFIFEVNNVKKTVKLKDYHAITFKIFNEMKIYYEISSITIKSYNKLNSTHYMD